jgi:hypothetical protein
MPERCSGASTFFPALSRSKEGGISLADRTSGLVRVREVGDEDYESRARMVCAV